MRWTKGPRSSDIEDRRGAGFGGGRMPMRMGLGGFLLLLALSFIFKKDFFALLGGSAGGPAASVSPGGPVAGSPEEEERADFVSFVLDDVQKTWETLLPEAGSRYQRAKLVFFREGVDSGCGTADSAVGPFYCPLDGKVYIDLGFFDDLRSRFGAPGDFAQAYVVAHEIGHHVQHLLGVADRVRQAQESRPDARNELSVLMELQADCLAGVWGHSTARRDLLEKGDVEEGLGAASAVGDDRIQKAARGRVSPESFTHGSAAQRVEWFRRGLESGRLASCDTFAAKR